MKPLGSSPKLSPRSRMKFPNFKRPPLGNIKQKIIQRKKKGRHKCGVLGVKKENNNEVCSGLKKRKQ